MKTKILTAHDYLKDELTKDPVPLNHMILGKPKKPVLRRECRIHKEDIKRAIRASIQAGSKDDGGTLYVRESLTRAGFVGETKADQDGDYMVYTQEIK